VRIGRCDSIQGLPVFGRVIGHAVWLYHRFALSLRDVEELARTQSIREAPQQLLHDGLTDSLPALSAVCVDVNFL
jgi:hypothetical protein